MSITTKTGDHGQTRLYSGETVNKRSRRIMCCGDIDELVSALGVVKYNIEIMWAEHVRTIVTYCNVSLEDADKNEYLILLGEIKQKIEDIQKDLFIIASEIATIDISKLKQRVNEEFLNKLDFNRINLEKKVELPKGFILPGGYSSYLDLSRSICRRCEREIVGLYNEALIDNKYILICMNRLSDYLYLLARYLEKNNYTLVKEEK